MSVVVLTPFRSADAVELGNRLWRRQVLPVGDINYKGRVLKFTRDYLSKLVRSFKDGAYAQVPFQLADAQNTHTNDPERYRGEITDMEVRDDGLWVTTEVSERGDALLKENPKLGVSARIVEAYDRADGKFFPAAIQHVLGTLDPRISWMGGSWQPIEASNPAPDTLVDLSNLTFAGEEAPPDAPSPALTSPASQPSEGTDMNLSDEQQARLMQLLNLPPDQFTALTAPAIAPDEIGALAGEEPAEELSDAELDELIAAAEQMDAAGLLEEGDGEAPYFTPGYVPPGEPQGAREPVAAGLSAEAQFAIDLANARAEETQREMAVINARLREQDYNAEKRRLADLGVPPFITELARPVLEGTGHTVELSNGKSADAGQIMRRVLTEYAAQARLLDLDVELGSPMDEPQDAAREKQAAARDDLIGRYKAMTGLK